MLSIIISSYQPKYYAALEKNIAETCGIAYEIIKIDNPNLMGICIAYNLGAEKANYKNLLFLHEDVEFLTKNWGGNLLTHLQKPDCGVVGLAGCNYVPNVPFCWWDNFESTFRNIEQYSAGSKLRDYTLHKSEEVSIIDGVFMACTKGLFDKINFNEKITDFHGYDLDFSAKAANFSTNLVISDIQLRHFSEGKPDKIWWENILTSRIYFSAPQKQKVNKKKELFFYKKLEEKLQKFQIPNSKLILLKFNNPRFIGYKAFLKNTFHLLFND